MATLRSARLSWVHRPRAFAHARPGSVSLLHALLLQKSRDLENSSGASRGRALQGNCGDISNVNSHGGGVRATLIRHLQINPPFTRLKFHSRRVKPPHKSSKKHQVYAHNLPPRIPSISPDPPNINPHTSLIPTHQILSTPTHRQT